MEKTAVSSTNSLQLTRRYTASPETVFQASTDPKALMQWFAPAANFSTPLAEVDLRVGGSYRIQMKDPSGETHTVGGIYREIRQSERLVFTWAWEEGGGCGGGTNISRAETLVTVELRQIDTGTEMVLTHDQFPTEETRDKHQQGWSGCLTRLGTKVGIS